MSTKSPLSRAGKVILALLVLIAMLGLYGARDAVPMSLFVLLITLGFIAFGLLIKSGFSSEDRD